MSVRRVVGSVFLCVAVAVSATPVTFGQAVDPLGIEGPATGLLDPGQELRSAVDPAIARQLADRLQRDAHPGRVWTETLFGTLAVATGEIDELSNDGRMTDSNRLAIAALTTLLVVDTVVELHPELGPVVAASLSRDDRSPIERICECDRRGSRACGCRVLSTGPGMCEYRVMCPSVFKAACSAVNVEMCVAETVFGILDVLE